MHLFRRHFFSADTHEENTAPKLPKLDDDETSVFMCLFDM